MESSSEGKMYNREEHEAQLLIMYRPYIEQLEYYWKGFGINSEQTVRRANTVLEHVELLLNQLVKEEQVLYTSLKDRVLKYQEELDKIAAELNKAAELLDPGLSLLQKEKLLQTELNALIQEKKQRLDDYNKLKEMEKSLCALLEMPESPECEPVPSEMEIKELEEHIRMLEDERQRRYKKFTQAKHELTTIMEQTEFSPETSFELEVVCYEDEKIVLSNKNLQQLTELVAKFKQRKREMEAEIKVSRDKLHALWDRLNIDVEEREEFLKKLQECRQSTLSALKHEIERCEEMKKQNIEQYIAKLRLELEKLWDACYLSEEERQKFVAFRETEFTEDVVDLHDKEVEKMKCYYEETQEILQKIEKRSRLWELMLKFERKAADPNRFHNRGGNLLQEERERKKILKDLPRLEEEILKAIEEYEENNDKTFLVHGVNFQEYIAKQWDDHIKEKENAKLQRQKQRGHVEAAKTPMKRTMLMSPASAPSKFSRTNMGSTTVRAPPTRMRRPPAPYTPADYAKRNATKKTPQRQFQTPMRRILTERNAGTPYHHDNNAHDTTSYSQFVVELNKEERNNCRSSVLSSGGKKVLGSKISQRKSASRSSRGSSNYSLRSLSKANSKSFRNTSRTPTKITPARAKLGLPFLI